MDRRSRFLPFFVLFLVFFGGVLLIISLPRESGGVGEGAIDEEVAHSLFSEGEGVFAALEPGYYTLFSLNVHDWTHPVESAVTVERVLDIHEQYGVPVDIYVTDPIFQEYQENYPELVDRLRLSEIATVAYHIRPPVPYYSGFDWLGLAFLSDEELYWVLYNYETHALDLATGEYMNKPGGYAYVRDVMGYAPISVGALPVGRVGEVLGRVYADLGATFMVSHDQASLGDKYGATGLFKRPEDVDVKIYERAKDTQDGGAVLEEYMQEESLDSPFFLGIKYHEDNFFTIGGTPWWMAFFSSDEKDKREGNIDPRVPPFPLEEAASGSWRMETSEEQLQDWELYESAVRYVAENSERVTGVNLHTLFEVLGK